MNDEVSDGVAADAAATPARRTAKDRIGARLGAARIAAGIELADIARDTRVPVRHLRAIEADDHSALPALPYAVGFVKSFARVVGVDADEAAARFRAETSIAPHAPMPASLEPLDERRLPSRGIVLVSVLLLVLILGGLTAYGAGWLDAPTPPPVVIADTPPAAAAAVTPATLPPAEATAGVEATVASPSASAPPAATAPPPAGGSGVSIVADQDAWIRVTAISPDDGHIVSVRTGLLAKGERFDLPAAPAGQRLWTGRAGALRITVGGRPIPALGGPVETVKNVSLTPGDLLARVAATPSPAPTTR